MKKTLVLGATTNEGRYAYLAANRLVRSGHPIVNVGLKAGEVAGVPIEKKMPPLGCAAKVATARSMSAMLWT